MIVRIVAHNGCLIELDEQLRWHSRDKWIETILNTRVTHRRFPPHPHDGRPGSGQVAQVLKIIPSGARVEWC